MVDLEEPAMVESGEGAGGGMTSPSFARTRRARRVGGAGYRPNAAGPNSGGTSQPIQRPGSAPGQYSPGSTNRPGAGGLSRPTPYPGGGKRPGSGGGRIAGPGGGNRPGSGDYRPGAGGNRPGLGDYGPGRVGIVLDQAAIVVAWRLPSWCGWKPSRSGRQSSWGRWESSWPGRLSSGYWRQSPGRPDFGDNLGIVNRPNLGNSRPGSGWFGNGNTMIANNRWGGIRRWPGHGWGVSLPLPRQLVSRELGTRPVRPMVRPGRHGVLAQERTDSRTPYLAHRESHGMGTGPMGQSLDLLRLHQSVFHRSRD